MKKNGLMLFSALAAAVVFCLALLAPGTVKKAEASGAHMHCICGGNCDVITDTTKEGHEAAVAAHTCDETVVWSPVSTYSELLAAVTASKTAETYIFLTADITFTGTANLTANNKLHICLNGHTMTGANNTRMFNTYTDAGTATTFTVCDCSAEKTGQIVCKGTQSKNRGHFLLLYFKNSKFELFGGTITGAKNTYATDQNGRGGAIAIYGATVNVYGGAFANNEAGRSGGAFNAGATGSDYTTFNIYDGLFSENHSVTAAGGCIAMPNGYGRIYGGTFVGNYANGYGGVIYIGGSSTLEISGGTFTNNTCTSAGGVMDIETSKPVTVSGGTFLNNSAPSAQGGTFSVLSGSTMNVTGGLISGGFAKTSGGNIYIGPTSKCTISGGTITGGTVGIYAADNGGTMVEGKGGNIYIDSSTANKTNGTLTMTGGVVTKGHAKTGTGGNIWVNGLANISGGEISEGIGTTAGNIFVNVGNADYEKSICTISGGVVRDGQSLDKTGVTKNAGNGLNIQINGGSTYVPGTLIVKGTAKVTYTDDTIVSSSSGGNIYIVGKMELSENAEISNGKSKINGGNITLYTKDSTVTYPATFNMSGGTIQGGCNTTTSGNGGNVFVGANSVMNMTGGLITKGYGAGNGYNLAVAGTLNASENATVKNDKGSYDGNETGNNSFSAQAGTARVNISGGSYGLFQAVSIGSVSVITGGTFSAGVSAYNGKLTIEDGVFQSSVGTTNDSGNLTIKGGYFAQAPYLTSGKTGTVLLEGGYYVSQPKTTFIKEGYVAASCEEVKNNKTYYYQIGEGVVLTLSTESTTGIENVAAAQFESGNGAVLTGGTVTIVAPQTTNGYTFVGWYKDEVTGSPVSTNPTTTVTNITEAAKYIAVYELGTAKLTLVVCSADASIQINGVPVTYTGEKYENNQIDAGSVIKITNTNTGALGWTNGCGKVVAGDPTFEFAQYTNLEFREVVAPETKTSVIFLTESDQVVKTIVTDTALTEGDIPAVPVRVGKTGGAWNLTLAEINQEIADAEPFVEVMAFADSYTTEEIYNTVLPDSTDPQIEMVLTRVTATGDTATLTFGAQRKIPAGYTLVEQGMVISTSALLGAASDQAEDLVSLEGQGAGKAAKTISTSDEMEQITILNVNNIPAGVTLYARGYMVLLASGSTETQVFYTDLAVGTTEGITLQ